jgi:photosystem II stability/assembly factor-like uncharacterized protein
MKKLGRRSLLATKSPWACIVHRRGWITAAAVALAAASALAGSVAGGTGNDARLIALARLVAPSFGYAVVSHDYGGRVYLTRDGRSWRDATPPGLEGVVEDTVFLDERRGWVVSSDCVGSAGVAVHRTGDGGRTWSSSRRVTFIGCHAGARAKLEVLDGRRAWLADGDPAAPYAELWRTLDGGATWSRVSGRQRFPYLGLVRFLDGRHGWLGRNEFVHRQRPYETRDAGRTWRPRSLALPKAWRAADALYDVPTFFGTRGVLPVTLVARGRAAVAFYATADAGGRWSLAAVRALRFRRGPADNPVARYVPTSVSSPDVWWIVGGRLGRVVEHTRDGGRSWTTHVARSLPASRSSAVSATSERVAWLTAYSVRGGSALFATADGGRSWRRLTLPR